MRAQRSFGPHLQLPDALAVARNIRDSLAHEGNQHVQQQDVGEDDKQQQQQHDKVSEPGMLLEIQVPHANGDLEELQGHAEQPPVHGVAPRALQVSQGLVLGHRGGIAHQGHQSWGEITL